MTNNENVIQSMHYLHKSGSHGVDLIDSAVARVRYGSGPIVGRRAAP